MKLLKLIRRKSYIIITAVLRLLVTGFFGMIIDVAFMSAVYEQRGYYAAGGECIVIAGLIYVIWKLTGYIARSWWEDRTE